MEEERRGEGLIGSWAKPRVSQTLSMTMVLETQPTNDHRRRPAYPGDAPDLAIDPAILHGEAAMIDQTEEGW